MTIVDKEMAKRLRQARVACGYAKAVDAARALGCNESTYHGHENGSKGISLNKILVYAKAFGVEVDWLAGWNNA